MIKRSAATDYSIWKALCLLVPIVLVGIFAYGLTRDPSHIPSALIGKHVPDFTLKELDSDKDIRRNDYKGRILVVNFWASWCGACTTEHQTLVELSNRFKTSPNVSFVGINYRDQKDRALKFLKRHGSFGYPSLVDSRGRTGIDFGVYGLPETYFIDSQGRIAYRHVGALDKSKALQVLSRLGSVE